MPKVILTLLCSLLYLYTAAQPNNRHAHALDYCVMKQAGKHYKDSVAVFRYTETEQKTYHAPRPWMTHTRNHTGKIWADHQSFSKQDTFYYNEKPYITREYYDGHQLLYLPYYAKEPIKIDSSTLAVEVYEIAKYHPAMLLHYVNTHKYDIDLSNENYPRYTVKIGDAVVTLTADYGSEKLRQVEIVKDEEVYGDVTYTIHYRRYNTYGHGAKVHYYPMQVTYSKHNGITDTISIQYEGMVAHAPALVKKPEDYTIHTNKPPIPHTIKTKKINDHIYMLHLPQGESAAMLVLFQDFSVIVDVPLNSKNGELALEEARKIAPDKPIKYYAFCHHHPWYVGGMRPFVHEGVTVLTQEENINYLNYVATAPHSLQPDAQHNDPQPLKTEVVGDTKTITDGEYEMVMYHIGMESEHTEDYTLFYFPQEQILFQGDMVFIKNDKPLSKAGGKQMALNKAVEKRELSVKTILQAWPWENEYNMKTIIPYSELEETVRLAKEAEKE